MHGVPLHIIASSLTPREQMKKNDRHLSASERPCWPWEDSWNQKRFLTLEPYGLYTQPAAGSKEVKIIGLVPSPVTSHNSVEQPLALSLLYRWLPAHYRIKPFINSASLKYVDGKGAQGSGRTSSLTKSVHTKWGKRNRYLGSISLRAELSLCHFIHPYKVLFI